MLDKQKIAEIDKLYNDRGMRLIGRDGAGVLMDSIKSYGRRIEYYDSIIRTGGGIQQTPEAVEFAENTKAALQRSKNNAYRALGTLLHEMTRLKH